MSDEKEDKNESKEKKAREVRRTSTFKGDLKRAKSHRKCDLDALVKAMEDIAARRELSTAMRDHQLQGKYPNSRDGHTDVRECHTSNDWLLVYRFPDEDSVDFIRTGTHSDLF